MSAKAVALIALIAFASLESRARAAPPADAASCGTPAVLGDGWPIATPEDAGLDGTRLCGIAERLKATEANVHGVVIVRHGKLVFEQYFSGHDMPWAGAEGQYAFDAATKHDMRSISKSVVSLLFGIAIDRKLIAGVDEPVLRFFPEYAERKTAGWDKITLRHLLQMSSGLRWNENLAWTPKNDEWHLVNDADPIGYVLQKPVAFPPDTYWNYNGGSTDLLGKVIEKASGTAFDAFAREALFDPLGIVDWQWMNYRNGRIAHPSGLRLRPRDAAKIGQLVLNKGSWNGRQIVSSDWIGASTRPRFQTIGYFGGLFFYGYQWWIGRRLSADREIAWIAGVGLGGQRLFIVPDLDLVVMVTSGLYASPRQGQAALDILYSFVMPAVREQTTAR
jgi:CubicO group peptidase (beta-lactamase class C family)